MGNLWDILASAVVLTSLIAMGIWIKKKGGLDRVYKYEAEKLFKAILTLSSLFDIIVLVVSAVEYRGAMFAGALPRFVIVTFVEILVNLFMVTQFNNIFQYYLYEHDVDIKYNSKKRTDAENKAIKFQKTIWGSVWWLMSFVFSIGCTYSLWILYLESINNIYLVTNGVSFPEFVTDTEAEMIPEASAFMMIWASTALEILICIITFKNYNSMSEQDIEIEAAHYEKSKLEKQAKLKDLKEKLPKNNTPVTPPTQQKTEQQTNNPQQLTLAQKLNQTPGGGPQNPPTAKV